MKFTHSALAIIAGTLASVLTPPEHIRPSLWARQNLIVPDGPRAGEPWSSDLTPYIIEPLDMLGPESGVNEIAVMKSAQTGFSMMLIAAIGHSIDRDPCRMAIMQPTDGALSDFNREKLQVAIDGSQALSRKVAQQVSRGARGSTTYSKVFPGGSLSMILASSGADLRGKTIRKLFRDEIDEYEDDLNGQGDPLELSDARLISFLATGDWKKADVSTPIIKGDSKIEKRFLAGDQRRWFVICPHCKTEDGSDSLFSFEWGPNFRYQDSYPYNPYYVAPCCGGIIQAHEKNALVRRGRWIASAERPGAYPSYHFDTLSSPFVPWEEVVKAFLSAGDDPRKMQTFWNLWLGLPYEIRGDAPDFVRLMERRTPALQRGRIPSRGLILTAAADVQMRGIYVEVLAFAPDRQTYVVEADFLDGSTEAPDSGAFELLKQRFLHHEFPDAYGRKRRVDVLGIDSGYRSHIVYAFVRNNQCLHPDTGRDLVLALDGRDGWGRPPIGTPKLVDINLAGQKVKGGAKLWPIGTWPLKGTFYADLNKMGAISGALGDPEGYCHFGEWLDETYFRQLTAEYLAEEGVKGRRRKIWKTRPSQSDNHFLDCRIYNLALAEYLGLSSTSPAEWADLARRRGMPEAAIVNDLFSLTSPAVQAMELHTQIARKDDPQDPFARLADFNNS